MKFQGGGIAALILDREFCQFLLQVKRLQLAGQGIVIGPDKEQRCRQLALFHVANELFGTVDLFEAVAIGPDFLDARADGLPHAAQVSVKLAMKSAGKHQVARLQVICIGQGPAPQPVRHPGQEIGHGIERASARQGLVDHVVEHEIAAQIRIRHQGHRTVVFQVPVLQAIPDDVSVGNFVARMAIPDRRQNRQGMGVAAGITGHDLVLPVVLQQRRQLHFAGCGYGVLCVFAHCRQPC